MKEYVHSRIVTTPLQAPNLTNSGSSHPIMTSSHNTLQCNSALLISMGRLPITYIPCRSLPTQCCSVRMKMFQNVHSAQKSFQLALPVSDKVKGWNGVYQMAPRSDLGHLPRDPWCLITLFFRNYNGSYVMLDMLHV